jgi:hypothetical protein
MRTMKQRTTGQVGPRLASLWRLLPGVILGGVLVGIVGGSALITENHKVVSFMAASVVAVPVFGIITVAAAWNFAGGRTPFARPWNGARSGGPPEPSHIHIARPSRGEES